MLPATLFLLVFGMLSACRRDAVPAAQVAVSLQRMAEFATVAYDVSKVVQASDDQTWFKIGDRRILITCEATAKAGIDWQQLGPERIQVSGRRIRIQLPPVQLLSVNMPPDKIRVAFQDIGFFRDRFSHGEQQSIMRQAQLQIERQVLDAGILQQAQLNTQTWLTGYLQQLGFEDIELRFDPPENNLIPPR